MHEAKKYSPLAKRTECANTSNRIATTETIVFIPLDFGRPNPDMNVPPLPPFCPDPITLTLTQLNLNC